MKNHLLLLIVSLLTFRSLAQGQYDIDSLSIILKSTKIDTEKANILYSISRAYWGNNPDMAMEFANQTLSLSEQIGYKKGMGNAYNSMGVITEGKGEYIQAFEFHSKALKIREEIGDMLVFLKLQFYCFQGIPSVLRIHGEEVVLGGCGFLEKLIFRNHLYDIEELVSG